LVEIDDPFRTQSIPHLRSRPHDNLDGHFRPGCSDASRPVP
jgi:hypothetical protein